MSKIALPPGVLGGKEALDALLPVGWRTPARRKRIREVNAMGLDELLNGEAWGWHPGYEVVPVTSVAEHDASMGAHIGGYVSSRLKRGGYVIVILPVGPTGQYPYVVDAVSRLGVSEDDLRRLRTINMDEWTDERGRVVDCGESFEEAMCRVLFDGMADLGYDWKKNSFFAKPDQIINYRQIIEDTRAQAAAEGVECSLLLVHGIGYVTHIAFIEAHMAAMYPRLKDWLAVDYVIGMPLCPLTLLQNAVTSFGSNLFGPSPYANTIGPGIYLEADYVIGGCDGALMQSPDEGYSMTWQAQTVHMTLAWGKKNDTWVPSSMVPQRLPGKLYVVDYLLNPLEAQSH